MIPQINRKAFATNNQAHEWLCQNSGMWAGLSHERQAEIHEELEGAGNAAVQTPTGVWFQAFVTAA